MAQACSKHSVLKEDVEKFKKFISNVDTIKVGDAKDAMDKVLESCKDMEEAYPVVKKCAQKMVDRHGVLEAMKFAVVKVFSEAAGDTFWWIFGLLMAVAIVAIIGCANVYWEAIVAFLAKMWLYVAPYGGWCILIGLTAVGAYAVYKLAEQLGNLFGGSPQSNETS